MPTVIKTYHSLSDMAVDANGVVTHVYTAAPKGIMINEDRNDMYMLKIYQDESGNLFSLLFPLT